MRKPRKMGPEMRREALQDMFHWYASSYTYYYQNAPVEARMRISKAFERFIESILDIDYMETLSVGHIFYHYISPIVNNAVIIKQYKLFESNKSEKNPEDKYKTIQLQNEISRRKMDDPRLKVLEDLFHRQVSSYIYYYQNVPITAQDRLNKAFERYIKSLIDVIDTDGDTEMLSLPIGNIFYNYIFPIVDHAIIVEVAKLW